MQLQALYLKGDLLSQGRIILLKGVLTSAINYQLKLRLNISSQSFIHQISKKILNVLKNKWAQVFIVLNLEMTCHVCNFCEAVNKKLRKKLFFHQCYCMYFLLVKLLA